MALGQVSVNFDPIRNAIFDWLHTAVNGSLVEGDANAIPVIRAEDNELRPTSGFIEYKFLTSFNKVGRDEVFYNSTENSFSVRGQREFVISVNIIGDKSAECAAEILGSTDRPSICTILSNAGISIRDDDSFSNVSVFQETDHEQRHVIDFRLGTALERLDAIEVIESVELKNKTINQNADDEYTVVIS